MAKPFCLYSAGMGSALAVPKQVATMAERKSVFVFINGVGQIALAPGSSCQRNFPRPTPGGESELRIFNVPRSGASGPRASAREWQRQRERRGESARRA